MSVKKLRYCISHKFKGKYRVKVLDATRKEFEEYYDRAIEKGDKIIGVTKEVIIDEECCVEIRAKKTIMHLIALEVTRRREYWQKHKKIPKEFSDLSIKQMKRVVAMEFIPSGIKKDLLQEIKTFELTITK